MVMVAKKRGRKAKPYVCPWNGQTIDGFYQCHDGRWRFTETGQKFSEKNPKLAVARFRHWQSQRDGRNRFFSLPLPAATLSSLNPHAEVTADDYAVVEGLLRDELGVGDHVSPEDDSVILRVPANGDPIRLLRSIPESVYFAAIAEDIVSRPKYVAEHTGIEQIGYLEKIEKPKPSPTLDEVRDFFVEKKQIMSKNWKDKCLATWREFAKFVGVSTLRELTLDHVSGYEDTLLEKSSRDKRKPPYMRQRIDALRSMVNYALRKGQWTEDSRRVYSWLKTMEKPRANSCDPKPISRRHFRSLLQAADPQAKALLLVALNFCMYGGEAVTIPWEEFDFEKKTFVSERPKNGVIRVARCGFAPPRHCSPFLDAPPAPSSSLRRQR